MYRGLHLHTKRNPNRLDMDLEDMDPLQLSLLECLHKLYVCMTNCQCKSHFLICHPLQQDITSCDSNPFPSLPHWHRCTHPIELFICGLSVLNAQPPHTVTHLIIFAVRVAATVLTEDAALAIEHISLITLAAFHTVLVAVTMPTSWSTLGLAHYHAAGIVSV